MAIYTKHGKEIVNDSVEADGECYHDEALIKIKARIKGETAPQTFYVSDLKADRGQREIEDVVRSNLKKQ